MSHSLLSVQHVHKQFAQHTALDDVSLDVEAGRVFGLLGPNGAGKTTLIRIINRITAPDSGQVFFDGRPLAPEDVQRIGYLPEERGLYKKMKVGEQAIYLAQLKGLSKAEATRRLHEWFERLDIMQWWNKKLEELSKGMQQKVQFVITVLHEPQLLIFDEPFSGFDPLNAELLKREILALRDKGHTIIYSTHNMASVEDVCDDIALINRSRLVLGGQVDEVRNRFRTGAFEVKATAGSLESVPGLFDVESQTQQRELISYQLHKHPEATTGQLLQHLATQLDIRSFAERMPSMHEIFIKTVNDTLP
ncbi:MAG: ABC transporter ATP-binding protein [Bacteroidales bacterium]|nr:ABC transporter ATP-binding protein [Bacteroidales bacterium]